MRKIWLVLLLLAISPALLYLFAKIAMDHCPSCAEFALRGISDYGLDWFWLNKDSDLDSLINSDRNSTNSYSVAMVLGFYMSYTAPLVALSYALRQEVPNRQKPETYELFRACLSSLAFLALVFYLQFGLSSASSRGRWRIFLEPSQYKGLAVSSLVEGLYFFVTVFFGVALLATCRELWRRLRGT